MTTVNIYVDSRRGRIRHGGKLRFRLRLDPQAITVEGDAMAITMTDTQQFRAAIAPVDAKGNPARVDGVPTWASSDEKVVAIGNMAADGMSAMVLAVGALGTAQIRVDADADLGAGVETITGVLDVEVIGGKAVALNISAGPVEEQAPGQ